MTLAFVGDESAINRVLQQIKKRAPAEYISAGLLSKFINTLLTADSVFADFMPRFLSILDAVWLPVSS